MLTPWNLSEKARTEVFAMLAYGVPEKDIAACIRVPFPTWVQWSTPVLGEVLTPEIEQWRTEVGYWRGRGVAERVRSVVDPFPAPPKGTTPKPRTLVDVASAKLIADGARWALKRARPEDFGDSTPGPASRTDIRIGIATGGAAGSPGANNRGAAGEIDSEGANQLVATLEAFGMAVPVQVRTALGLPAMLAAPGVIEVSATPVPTVAQDAPGGDPPSPK